jgi:heme/copper-type cytochrome/quinol oxidase subunit 3
VSVPASALPTVPTRPDDVARNIAAGTRLWAGATTFVFFGPFFAYFYLRSLNTGGMWRPAHVDPPQSLGATIMVLVVAAGVALVLASRVAGSARDGTWKPLVALALVLGLASVVLQGIEYARLGFGPTNGGYASVFAAWTGLNALFVLGTTLWAETLLAYGLRTRRQTPTPADDPDTPRALIHPRLAALAFYWTYLAGLGVVMWAVLYLV